VQIEMGDFANIGLLYAIIGTRGGCNKKRLMRGIRSHSFCISLYHVFFPFRTRSYLGHSRKT
jgi:hypothetical protein